MNTDAPADDPLATRHDNTERFRQLLGEHLDRLSFEDRQTVAQCLIKKVVVTGEQVAISYVLPFDQAPQVYNSRSQQPEGTLGHFYRLRLADLDLPTPVTGIFRHLRRHGLRQVIRNDPVKVTVWGDQLEYPHLKGHFFQLDNNALG
jgi:hypothetical protein